MLIFIKGHPYIVAGTIVFLLMFLLGIFALDASWSESLLGAAVLSVVGVFGIWWKEKVWP